MFRPELQVIADAFARESRQCWDQAVTCDETGNTSAADRLSHRATRLAVAAGYLRQRASRPEVVKDC